MSRTRALFVSIAILFILVGTSAIVNSIPAHAQTCATGNFFLKEVANPLYIIGEGHNNVVNVESSGGVFCLVNSGTQNWYEFLDVGTNECLNVASGAVYEDSCIDSTPEQWNQSIPGDHHWENRHYGSNGMLTGTDHDGGTVFVDSLNSLELQSWATPSV